MGRPALVVGALVAVGAALAGCSAPSGPTAPAGAAAQVRLPAQGGDQQAYHGAVLTRPYRLPSVPFAGSDGATHRLDRAPLAPVTLLFFGYTHCPDECPATLGTVAAALRQVTPAVRTRIALGMITTDPARDTPVVMRDYLARFDPSFVGLATDDATSRAVAADLGVAVTGITRLPGGGYDVGHQAHVIGFDQRGRGRLVWLPDVAVADLAADLTRLASPEGGAS
jgi:protein SCO1/2